MEGGGLFYHQLRIVDEFLSYNAIGHSYAKNLGEDDHSGVGEGVRMLFHYVFLVNLGGSNEMIDL